MVIIEKCKIQKAEAGNFCLHYKSKNAYLIAAIPGNSFPSKNSSIAPPPVET